MNQSVNRALTAGLHAFGKAAGQDSQQLLERLETAFSLDAPYLEKVERLDEAFDEYPGAEELREIVFDLLLMNFFAADVEKLEGDYLESPEWEDIEEQTIDRGTELLNLLLYLRECADEQLEPQLEDYLREFLLVDEDEFQDEHRIYEPVIANQILVDSPYSEMARVASKLPEDHELAELFYPLMGFFAEQRPTADRLVEFATHSANPAFDTAVYQLLVAYNH